MSCHIIEGNLNGEMYRDILENELLKKSITKKLEIRSATEHVVST